MASSDIKLPEKVYVGFQGRRTQDEVPLGFMVPYTDDEAGKKRQTTVDRWAAGYNNQKAFKAVILDNTPMIGFKIGRSVRRSGGWNGSGATYIRIEDPRGFELEITIENLTAVMDASIMEHGEILQECAWGRVGNRNILLTTNSEPYMNATPTTSAVAAALGVKDVTVGDKVRMISGEVGVFMGTFLPITKDYSNVVEIGTTRKPVIRIDNPDGPVYMGFPKFLAELIAPHTGEPLTNDQIQAEMAAAMTANPYCCRYANDNGYKRPRAWVYDKKKTKLSTLHGVNVTLLALDKLAEQARQAGTNLDPGTIRFKMTNGALKKPAYQCFQTDRNSPDYCYYGLNYQTIKCQGMVLVEDSNNRYGGAPVAPSDVKEITAGMTEVNVNGAIIQFIV